MDPNNSMFAVLGPIDGVVLIQSPVTTLILIVAAVAVVALVIGLLIGLLIGRTRTPKATAPAAKVSAAAPQAADEDEIVAVIAATILAMESARTGTQLVLRGITHVGSEGTPWSAAGRKNLMK